jgi:hypothetical protein
MGVWNGDPHTVTLVSKLVDRSEDVESNLGGFR